MTICSHWLESSKIKLSKLSDFSQFIHLWQPVVHVCALCFFCLFFAVNVGLSVAMWISIVPNVPILPLVYFVSPPCYYWVYYGLQLAAGSIPLRRHLGLLGQDFPNRIRYSSSDLKSIRKLCPKDRLPADIWSKLGSLGIRKPCRGKRAGRNRRRYHGYNLCLHSPQAYQLQLLSHILEDRKSFSFPI